MFMISYQFSEFSSILKQAVGVDKIICFGMAHWKPIAS